MAAHHDYRQFMRSHKHRAVAHVTADAAMPITRHLAHGPASAHPGLTARWQARAMRLGLEHLHKRVVWYAASDYPPVAESTLEAAASGP